MQTVSAHFVSSRKVLLRMDLDVPIKDGQVADDFRLKAGLPSLELCLIHASSVIILGHLGRPEGKEVAKLSVKPVVSWLENWYSDLNLPEGKLHILENLRFEKGESFDTAQDKDEVLKFAKELASLGDVFVNEAFAAHHKSASTTVLPTLLPSAAGLRFAKEVETINNLAHSPKRPLVALIGGAKIEDKYPAIQKLSLIADAVLVGGLLPKQIEEQKLPIAQNVLLGRTNQTGVDIDEKTIQAFSEIINTAKEIIWAGPMGKYEEGRGNIGDRSLAKAIISSKAKSIIGGGDTTAALEDFIADFSFVSTGGGAMLELLTKGTLPTIAALG